MIERARDGNVHLHLCDFRISCCAYWFIYLAAISLSNVERNAHDRGMKVIDNDPRPHSKGLSWKNIYFNLCDFCLPVMCVGLFIESLVELIKAACNFYDANAEAIKNNHINPHPLKLRAVFAALPNSYAWYPFKRESYNLQSHQQLYER